MRTLPDKFFDLCIADPPYGINADTRQGNRAGKKHGHAATESKDYGESEWDTTAPDEGFFEELFRVSKNQIIWGANHFISKIPYDSPCWIVWDKDNGNNGYADCELAWTSFNSSVRKFKYRWMGMLQENMAHKEERIHATQKPVALYAWLLNTYGGGKIYDPMMGSQSSRIAAYKLGYDFWGCEINKDFFDKGNERFRRECFMEIPTKTGIVKQFTLFDI